MKSFTIDYSPLMNILYEREIKLTDLGKEIGFSPNTIAKFKKKDSLTLNNIGKICAYLEVEIQEVVKIKLY